MDAPSKANIIGLLSLQTLLTICYTGMATNLIMCNHRTFDRFTLLVVGLGIMSQFAGLIGLTGQIFIYDRLYDQDVN